MIAPCVGFIRLRLRFVSHILKLYPRIRLVVQFVYLLSSQVVQFYHQAKVYLRYQMIKLIIMTTLTPHPLVDHMGWLLAVVIVLMPMKPIVVIFACFYFP